MSSLFSTTSIKIAENTYRLNNSSRPKLIVILGPTASGKSELALKLARRFNGEIISADSRQIYKGMIIGAASIVKDQKPKTKDQKSILINGIPHHLFQIINPNQEFNSAIYKKLALKTIKDIQKRGKLPFLVGGTGLYIKAIVDNIDFPQVSPQKKLRKALEKKTASQLFKIYKKLDFEGAKFIEKENKRRLIRAIEVCKMTGKPFWQQRKKSEPLFRTLQIGIKVSREKLKKRISQRTKKMFQLGLKNEAEKLIKKYDWLPSLQTIGYQEWRKFFAGKIDEKEVEKLIIQHTVQFTKRQMTWFKKNQEIYWIKNQKEAENLIEKFIEK